MFAPPDPTARIPPLVPGDRLTRDEFERRYTAMPNLKKAELIDGVVYLPSTSTWLYHGGPRADLIGWLGTYHVGMPGVCTGANTTVRLDAVNEMQPDVALIVLPEYGGQIELDADGFVSGAPELVADVAPAPGTVDVDEKMRAYCRNGVREYLFWRVADRILDSVLSN
ncbi:Uma2 family endonuclease [Fimbriiglobus ruber]|uniref:Putative restriction endonuclease domain-containing protein n=1 Tax=Fimbriiglobus ruber TaxID=1908690 RepID=A0A225E7Z2_9BACT|nr:Uma2 family endonuclease [Fimbriiglobus ruber]OWK45629.1 hypothetical protein FRUB_01960 [Fimbriiglobus ruber]